MLLRISSGRPSGVKPLTAVHRDAVAVGVDQLLVDPVAAALGQAFDVQLARPPASPAASCRRSCSGRCRCRESRSRCGSPGSAAACPAAPASPTAGCSRWSSRLFAASTASMPGSAGNGTCWMSIQRVGAPRHLDVVRDERPLAHQLVRRDDEVRHVPAERSRRGCSRPPPARRRPRAWSAGARTTAPTAAITRADDERDGDHEHADDASRERRCR